MKTIYRKLLSKNFIDYFVKKNVDNTLKRNHTVRRQKNRDINQEFKLLNEDCQHIVDEGITLVYEHPVSTFENSENIHEEIKEYTLLIVEDNKEMLMLLTRTLGRKYHLFTATTGTEALEIVDNHVIDLIITDIMMPVMDGLELCQILKNNPKTNHIPIIMLTAKVTETDIVCGYDTGADGYITKPFSFFILEAKINNLLKSKQRVKQINDVSSNLLVFETKNIKLSQHDEEFIKKVVDFIHLRIDDPELNQQDLINALATSKSTLYKKLKSLTGFNTSAFISFVRLKAACKFLSENKNVRISELAYSVGFSDPKYFSFCFKKEFGITPTEYIEKLQIDKQAK